MKENEILDKLGEVIIETIYNKQLNSFEKIVKGESNNFNMLDINKLFSKLTEEEKGNLISLNKEIIEDVLFDFLKIFDEKEDYKLMYVKEGFKDVQKIAEADPLCNGYLSGELFNWIDKFSK